MTIPSTARKAGPLLGNGATTSFPFTFKVFAASDIAVTIANSLGVETPLVLNTDYSVTLNPNQETSPGGTVTYPISGSPLPTGSRLVIVGNLPYDQTLDLPSGGNFSPLALENQLDRATMQIQQLRENVSRALQLPVTTAGVQSVQLPQPSANDLIGWDSGGSNLANYALSDIATAVGFGTFRYDTFTGDGVETQFALSEDPAILANLDVSISGVTQVPGVDYTLTSSTLVFTSAPANGTNILARYGRALAINGPVDSSAVVYQPAGTGAVATNVQTKLRESVSVLDFGASTGASGAANLAAIQAAINASAGKVVRIPAGTYNVAGTITVTQAVSIEGDGTNQTFIQQQTPNVDTFLFQPTTAGVTSAFLSGPRIQGVNVTHTSVAASSTTGAGVRFVQCNGYKLFNVSVNNAPEGITIQGGQFGSLKSFQIFASSGLTATADSALLYLRQAPYGVGLFQPCYTVEVEDFRLSASKLRETCIYIRNADGAQFANGYVALGGTSLLKVKAERDNSYVAAAGFTNVYFDCVGAGNTPYGVDIPADGFSNSFVYGLKIGSGCVIGNGDQIGVLGRKPETMLLSIEGATILNMTKWAIDVEGSTALTDLHINGCQIQNTGDGTTGAIRAETGRSLNIVGNTFSSTENIVINLSGTFTQGTISGNSNSSAIAELSNSATFTTPLVVAGNSGRSVSGSSFRGIRPGNTAIDRADTLDWYEEGTFTPVVTFGGASVGLTYTAQIGSFTRIGNRVFFNLRVVLSAKGSSTGDLRVEGLPYVASDVNVTYPFAVRLTNTANDFGANHCVADLLGGGSSMRILTMNTAFSTETQLPMNDTHATDTLNIFVTGNYRV